MPGYVLEEMVLAFCNKHYNQLLSLMAEKVHQEKLKGVQTRFSYVENSQNNLRTKKSPSTLSRNPGVKGGKSPRRKGNMAQVLD